MAVELRLSANVPRFVRALTPSTLALVPKPATAAVDRDANWFGLSASTASVPSAPRAVAFNTDAVVPSAVMSAALRPAAPVARLAIWVLDRPLICVVLMAATSALGKAAMAVVERS